MPHKFSASPLLPFDQQKKKKVYIKKKQNPHHQHFLHSNQRWDKEQSRYLALEHGLVVAISGHNMQDPRCICAIVQCGVHITKCKKEEQICMMWTTQKKEKLTRPGRIKCKGNPACNRQNTPLPFLCKHSSSYAINFDLSTRNQEGFIITTMITWAILFKQEATRPPRQVMTSWPRRGIFARGVPWIKQILSHYLETWAHLDICIFATLHLISSF